MESATDYISTDPYCVFPHDTQDVVIKTSLFDPFDADWPRVNYGNPYHAAHGHQAFFCRYNPKARHDQIKPNQGHKVKRYNRKSFPKTRMNFRES